MLTDSNLEFHSGNSNFSLDDFKKEVAPYFNDLQKHNRTKYLCVFKYGDGSPVEVTGYSSDVTLNVTNNTRIIKSEASGGMWAVYQTVKSN